MTPQRIRLRRTKGYRKPEGAVVVARPSKWGNPWRVGHMREGFGGPSIPATADYCVRRYRSWLTARTFDVPHGVDRAVILRDLPSLAGRDLACWCPLDAPCHADVLLELANTKEKP